MTNIVLDTNVWRRALCDSDWNYEDDYVISVFKTKKELGLAIDYEQQILREYRDNLGAESRRFEKYYNQFSKEKRISLFDSKIPEKQLKELKNRGFHKPEDQIFLGTAYHADKILITADGDYGIEIDCSKKDAKQKKLVNEYITEKMGVTLHTPKQCMDTEYLQTL